MNLDSITLTQMRYALALQKEGSFVKAAKFSHITQSTLSLQIQKLEDLLECNLFDRKSKPVRPTKAGQAVLDVFAAIVGQTEKLPYLVGSNQYELRGHYTIGIIPTLSVSLSPKLAECVIDSRASGLKLTIEELQTERLIERIQRSEVDAGLLIDHPPHKDLKSHFIQSEELVCYVSEHHALAGVEKVDPSQLKNSDAWILQSGHCFGDQSLKVCQSPADPTTERKFTYRAGNFDTLMAMVDEIGGFTILPENYCRIRGLLSSTRIRLFREPVPVRHIYYVHKRDSFFSRIHEYLIEALRKSTEMSWKKRDKHHQKVVPYFPELGPLDSAERETTRSANPKRSVR